ncbi:uncharacterized protein [Prorops nasuta]|uniref:uncharacterized protein n=1 Tax=Prorops nasuta TaxID=863751 RepID=UPI0034CD68C6
MTRPLILLVLMVTSIAAIPFQDLDGENRLEKQEANLVSRTDEAKMKVGKRLSSLEENAEVEAMLASEEQSSSSRKQQQRQDAKRKLIKKARKHKALLINYPLVAEIQQRYQDAYDPYEATYRNSYGLNSEGRLRGSSKRYQESNIFYIRLPPTPYTFVPGLGYISQPPVYSTAALGGSEMSHARPQSIYQHPVNSFIKLPIDFVSNGKPTSVYQWTTVKPINKRPTDTPITNLDNLSEEFVNNGKPTSIYQWQMKRPADSFIETLNKGPYVFNGRPTSLYLLKPDGTTALHQSITYPAAHFQDNNSYY